MANPYVFIVGCPRSGTTLLQHMVDAHPQLAIMSEAQWIPRRFKAGKGLTPEGMVLPGLIPQLLEHPRFAALNISPEELRGLLGDSEPVSYADFVAGIFDLYGKAQGKALVGNKTPGFVRRLDAFHALWPKARFVHLIRDGRDVCLSMGDWPKAQLKHPGDFATWKDDSVSTTALWWELNVRLGRAVRNSLGPELYYEVRYESLVCNPAEECEALCAFLGVPYDGAMLRFHEGRTKADPALGAKTAWRPITPGLRDWRSQMPAEDVERFEAAAGELLDELGHLRAILSPRPEALEQASQIRDSLAQDPNWNQVVRREVERLKPASKLRELLAQDSHWKQTAPGSQAERVENASRLPDSRAVGGGF